MGGSYDMRVRTFSIHKGPNKHPTSAMNAKTAVSKKSLAKIGGALETHHMHASTGGPSARTISSVRSL